MRSRLLALPLLAALIAAVVLWAPHDLAGLRALVAAAGPWAPALLLAVWLVATPLLFPGHVLSALSGLLLGPVGIAIALIGTPLGALAAFLVSRHLARPVLEPRLPRPVRAVTQRLERGGFRAVVLLRLAPGMPIGVLNPACGTTRLCPRAFTLGSAVGAAPRVLLYGILGGAAAQAGPWVAAGGAAVVGLAAAVVLLRRRRAAPQLAGSRRSSIVEQCTPPPLGCSSS